MRTLRVALAQINTTVGDLEGNAAKVLEYSTRARDLGANLVAFPELTLPGYPPEDLLLRRNFIEDNQRADGSVSVPEALRPYMGNRESIGPAGKA